MNFKLNNLQRKSQKLFVGSVLVEGLNFLETNSEIVEVDVSAEIWFEGSGYELDEGVACVDFRSVDVTILDEEGDARFSFGPSSKVIKQLDGDIWLNQKVTEIANQGINIMLNAERYDG